MKKTTLLISIISILFFGCKSKKVISDNNTISADTTQVLVAEKTINIDSINNIIDSTIKNIVIDLDSVNSKVDGQFIFSHSLLPESYKNIDYHQLWKSKKNRTDAINAILKSKEHGLVPKDYHINEINKLNDNYSNLSPENLAVLDILLTDGIILYAYHLIEGKLNPEDLSYSWNFIHNKLPENTAPLLHAAISEERLTEILYSLEPQDNEYKKLKEQYKINEKIINNGGWNIVNFETSIHPNAENEEIPQLRKRLIAEGYLLETDTSSSKLYDKKLIDAVKHFQKQHGLTADGVIGKHTLKIINISVEEKQKTIVCNLERRRWIDYPFEKPYIKVNIASYRMQFIENYDVVYASKVVVGKTQKQTPMFEDKLEIVVINPTWTLPYSITSTETLRKLKKDPNYLDKHNMNLIDRNGKVINNHGIDWHKYKEGHFPYTVRQGAGPSNALGRVKFLFPNKYAIYLHDTPSKYLFSKDERDFSHGCIRLQNPLNFAEFLLKRENATKWNKDVIAKIVKTEKTKNISLRHKYPILLMYQTAGTTQNDEIFYYADIYKRDAKVYELLVKTTN